MEICPDYEDLFKALNEYKIHYLVIGAHAYMYYAEPRFTKDIDVWVPSALNDPQKVYAALKAFGVPMVDLSPADFQNKKLILQIGVPPVRIDILVNVEGVSAKQAWKNRKQTKYGKESICVLDIKDLIATKQKAGRARDLLDIQNLTERMKRKKKKTKK